MSDIKYNNKWFKSGLELLNEMLYGKWKFTILWNLNAKPLRFSDLRKNIPSITDRMLSLQLKELEEEGFVTRLVSGETPPKVDYALTEKAIAIIPALTALDTYGRWLMEYSPAVNKTSASPLPLSEEEESFFDQL